MISLLLLLLLLLFFQISEKRSTYGQKTILPASYYHCHYNICHFLHSIDHKCTSIGWNSWRRPFSTEALGFLWNNCITHCSNSSRNCRQTKRYKMIIV